MNLKKFIEFDAINEAIIKPFDFKEDLSSIIDYHQNINNIDDLNACVNSETTVFVDFDTFYNSLVTDKEREQAPPREMNTRFGIQFALFNKHISKINVVILPDFFKNIKNKQLLPQIVNFLQELLRHESIHLQQVERSPKSYSLERSPKTEQTRKEYFSHHSEQMAFALSFVDNMTQQGFSKEEMLKAIRNKKKTNIWIQHAYSQVLDDKQYQKFLRYVYDYINDIE
jgi:hypothetical protein